MNGPGTDRKALRRAKTRLVVALALSVTAAIAAVPQATAADGRYFYVVNLGTRMMAEVTAHRTDDGAPVVLWPNNGGTSQQFSVQRLAQPGNPEPLPEQWFLLQARHSGKCLKTDGFQPGAAVIQETCSGDSSQLWRLRTVIMTAAECPVRSQCFVGRRLVLENYYDRGRRCLEAANGHLPGPPTQGAGLRAWNCIATFSAPNAVNQDWELVDTQEWNAPFVIR